MRALIKTIMLAGAALAIPAADAQSYFMRQTLPGLGRSSFPGKWETQTTPSGSCQSSGTDMVKATTTTASCTGGACDPATRPSTAPGTTSCKVVCDGPVQQRVNGAVATANGKSTSEEYLGSLDPRGWNAEKAFSCESKGKSLGKRVFGCTTSRSTGATNAWVGDFSIPSGATVANGNLDYVACRYE